MRTVVFLINLLSCRSDCSMPTRDLLRQRSVLPSLLCTHVQWWLGLVTHVCSTEEKHQRCVNDPTGVIPVRTCSSCNYNWAELDVHQTLISVRLSGWLARRHGVVHCVSLRTLRILTFFQTLRKDVQLFCTSAVLLLGDPRALTAWKDL